MTYPGHEPNGVGTVATSPRLPAGFSRTFESNFVQTNGIRQHVVIGGDGPPLLLIHGWPQNWYAWRFVMPELAKDYRVIAVDQRGIGRTEKAPMGYDTATLATDLAMLMTELGHETFAVVGHDTGLAIAYALAADYRDRVEYLAVAEVPGPPGATAGPPLFTAEPVNNKLWHIPFNRVDDELIVDMVRSHADGYFRYEYTIQSGGLPLPDYAIDYYVGLYNRDRAALRASFQFYRAWDMLLAQNARRARHKLEIPVLGIGGQNSWAGRVADGMGSVALDVEAVVIPGVGHWVAEQAPGEVVKALNSFLNLYRGSF